MKVEKGWVTLAGTVDWQYQRVTAETAVRELSGVIGLSNLFEVRPRVAPRDVKKILDALKRSAELEADAIRVNVIEGKVVLEGNVKAWFERGIAEHAAWSAPGVKAVQDDLAIGYGEDCGAPRGRRCRCCPVPALQSPIQRLQRARALNGARLTVVCDCLIRQH